MVKLKKLQNSFISTSALGQLGENKMRKLHTRLRPLLTHSLPYLLVKKVKQTEKEKNKKNTENGHYHM